MEERIIDDEYGRGVRLKRTKEGFIDATDEALEGVEGLEKAEEAVFEFPILEADEDDEDLVGITPEEAMALRKKKEEEALQRKADYERTCREGEELLASGSYHGAELKFERALALDDEATEASVGYWRAKTADFTQPDVLIGEYAEAGVESLEYDLGYKAVEIIKAEYASAFAKRVAELTAEEEPLQKEVEEKQASRREIISARIKRSTLAFLCSAIPTVALFILTVVLGMKNFTTREDTFILPTILSAVGFIVAFIAFIVCTNKWINDFRMRATNENLASTENGARLLQLRSYKELYLCLLPSESVKN